MKCYTTIYLLHIIWTIMAILSFHSVKIFMFILVFIYWMFHFLRLTLSFVLLQDLQVKSSPPAQPTPVNNDPAIIQVKSWLWWPGIVAWELAYGYVEIFGRHIILVLLLPLQACLWLEVEV